MRVDLAGGFQDQRFLVLEVLGDCALPRWSFCGWAAGLVCRFFALGGGGGGGGGSAGSPASSLRYFTTFLLCSASVELKKWPPWVFATKDKKLVSAGCTAARSDASPGFPIGPGGRPPYS